MIYVTGDTHGLTDFHKLHVFAGEHPELTKNDYIIVAGDCGVLWSNDTLVERLRYYTDLPFTILFVDGNHENFDMINSYPVEIWNGGKVHKIKPDIIHLMRGQIFELEGKKLFAFGGATSIDKYMRREGLSWWKQELPSYEELDEGIATLKHHGGKVDYIITHSCSERALAYPAMREVSKSKMACPEVGMLSYIEENLEFKHWFFGHYHIDKKLGSRYTVLYQNIVSLD